MGYVSSPLGAPNRATDHFDTESVAGAALVEDTAVQNTDTTAWFVTMALTSTLQANVPILEVSPDNAAWTKVSTGAATGTAQLYAIVPPSHYYRLNGRDGGLGTVTTVTHRRWVL